MVSTILLLGGATGLVGQWIAGVRILFSGEVGIGGALALIGVGLLFLPILGGMVVLGGCGVRRCARQLQTTLAQREKCFAREFALAQMHKQQLPRIARLRRSGVGDVVLDVDSYYLSDPDSNSGTTVLNEVGFLSVHGAEAVAEIVAELVEAAVPRSRR